MLGAPGGSWGLGSGSTLRTGGHPEHPAGQRGLLSYGAKSHYAQVFGVGATFQWIHVPKLHYELVVDGECCLQS